MKCSYFILLLQIVVISTPADSVSEVLSLAQAKRILEEKIYTDPHMRVTLYCGATFDEDGVLMLPEGFSATKFVNRAYSLEWEHVVPVESFGRAFKE